MQFRSDSRFRRGGSVQSVVRILQSDWIGGEAGQTMSEYAIVLAVICVGVVTTLGVLRVEIVAGLNQAITLL
jgi:Flp pilus assembly pilin Flp